MDGTLCGIPYTVCRDRRGSHKPSFPRVEFRFTGRVRALTHHVNAVEARLVGQYRMDRAGASLQYPTTSQKWVYFGSIKSSCTTLSNRSDTLDRCGIVIECQTPNATTTSKPVTTNTVLFHPSVSFSLYI